MRKTDGKQSWPFIKRRLYPNGTIGWTVDARLKSGGVGGSRRTFETKGEAETYAQQQRTKRTNEGVQGVTLPDRLRVEALECVEQLAPVGATLREAVAYYLKHARPVSGERVVGDVVKEFLRSKTSAGLRETYLSVQRYVLQNVFAGEFGERPIHQVTHLDLETWMERQTWALRTRKNYLRDLQNLFGFAIRRGYCAANPVERIEKPKVPSKAPGILTVGQAAALLKAAGAGDGAMLPAVAIGLFCGVRSAELQRLDWRHIRLEQSTIEITAENAKMSERRVVDVPPNLAAWLLPFVKSAGPIAPAKSFNWRLSECARAAGILTWPKNAMRHSFATFHYGHHRNAAATVAQLGHFGDTRTFVNSYRDVVQPSEAAAFWVLSPG